MKYKSSRRCAGMYENNESESQERDIRNQTLHTQSRVQIQYSIVEYTETMSRMRKHYSTWLLEPRNYLPIYIWREYKKPVPDSC